MMGNKSSYGTITARCHGNAEMACISNPEGEQCLTG